MSSVRLLLFLVGVMIVRSGAARGDVSSRMRLLAQAGDLIGNLLRDPSFTPGSSDDQR